MILITYITLKNTTIITKQEVLDNKEFYINEIKSWKVFIYPTDTVLGIGCDILFDESVERIFQLKHRENKPLLVIIPELEWIDKNCNVSEKNKEFIAEKLPGAYSFIVELKDSATVNQRVTNNSNTLWIRIPDNWFAEIIAETDNPFISTSVNISGQPSCLKIEDIPEEILSWVDYVIQSDDEFLWRSSRLIDMTTDEMKVLRQ